MVLISEKPRQGGKGSIEMYKKKIKKESPILTYLREQREAYARQVQTRKLGSHRKSAKPNTEGNDSA
jgi:hypothetical protein